MLDLKRDTHSHLMPGVDDGSRNTAETLTMARGLCELGVEHVHLTPHQYRFGCAFSRAEALRRTGAVSELLERNGIRLEVVAGAEYFYGDRLLNALRDGDDLVTFRHDGQDCLLIELPEHRPVLGVRRLAENLLQRAIRPVMAHPERAAPWYSDSRLYAWRDTGWWFQLDLLSLAGRYGAPVCTLAHSLMQGDLYELVGGDLHRPADLGALKRAHRIVCTVAPGKDTE